MATKTKSTAIVKSDDAADQAMVVGAEGFELPGVGKADPAHAARLLAEMRDGTMAPKIISLEEPGSYVTGILIGEGSGVDFKDADGEERILPTFNFRLENGFIAGVIASHQMSKELPNFIGKNVRVMKLGQFTSKKGRRVNDFAIAAL